MSEHASGCTAIFTGLELVVPNLITTAAFPAATPDGITTVIGQRLREAEPA